MSSFTEKDRDTCIMVHLLRMCLVDGHRSEEEKALIMQHQMELGLTPEDVERCSDLALDDNNPAMPEDGEGREEIFGEIVRLAACDGLEEDEIEYLKTLASVFQIEPETAKGLIHGANS